MTTTRRPVIAGNWKLFKTLEETRSFFAAIRPRIDGVDHCDLIVAPPFTALRTAVEAASGTGVSIASQDVYWESEGAFTGEVSAPMLAEIGCGAVIIGHSERRQLFGETDQTVSQKIPAVLASGMQAIVCVGETLGERDGGEAETVVSRQLRGGLARLTAPDLSHIMVAYEPVWAIGTGRTASPQIAQGMHAGIRAVIGEAFGEGPASGLRILYGGSVKPANIGELMDAPDIDGALVGGASLEASSFAEIVRYPQR
jgi:triosephosphate isomerase